MEAWKAMRWAVGAAGILAVVLVAPAVGAQGQATPAAAGVGSAAGTVSTPASAPGGAAPAPADAAVGQAGARAFDPEARTAEYLAQLSPPERAKSDAYFEGGYWIILWELVVGLIAAWVFLGTGLSVRIRDRVERITSSRWLQTAMYVPMYIVISTLLTLPWDIYTGFFREHQYGMSNLTLGGWMVEQAKTLVIGLILGTAVLVVVYGVLRRAPRTWWVWGALVAIAFTVFVEAIGPTVLEPAFNDFKPLPESQLKEQILSMARANGIPATDVYGFDASKQTKRMSAHVSGILGTTRISMNDNLMHRGSSEEIRAVLGHEMGHYVLHHVYKGTAFIGIIILIGFACLRWAFDRIMVSRGERWGLRGIGDVAALPLLAALLSIYFFILTPINNTLTRTMEAEADNYGLNMSRQPDGFAQAAMHLSEYRKMQPGPLEEILFYDHPSGYHRIHRSMVWKAEHLHDADIAAYDAAHPTIGAPGSFRRAE
jgi:STE24 endopeptidase